MSYCWHHRRHLTVNTLRLRQNIQHIQTTFSNAFSWMKICLRLRFHWSLSNNTSTLVQIMAWFHAGDKPLPELMVVSLLMHIYLSLSFYELIDSLIGDNIWSEFNTDLSIYLIFLSNFRLYMMIMLKQNQVIFPFYKAQFLTQHSI